jgi:hypothetical protein
MALVYPEASCRIALWVSVDQEHALTERCKLSGDVDGSRRFADPAFLVCYSDSMNCLSVCHGFTLYSSALNKARNRAYPNRASQPCDYDARWRCIVNARRTTGLGSPSCSPRRAAVSRETVTQLMMDGRGIGAS